MTSHWLLYRESRLLYRRQAQISKLRLGFVETGECGNGIRNFRNRGKGDTTRTMTTWILFSPYPYRALPRRLPILPDPVGSMAPELAILMTTVTLQCIL